MPKCFSEHKLRYICWNPRAFWPSIDSNVTTMFKAQKESKDIIKIVHVTSAVQPYLYEAMRILFVHKEMKITTLLNDFFSSGSVRCQKKYYGRFIKLWLNHWCHECGSSLAVYVWVRKLSYFIKNIVICVRRWMKVLRVWKDMRVSHLWHNFHFWVNYPFLLCDIISVIYCHFSMSM